MPGTVQEEWLHDDEHHCAHCLTELESWAARCYRCGAHFEGTLHHDLVAGRPDFGGLM